MSVTGFIDIVQNTGDPFEMSQKEMKTLQK
jgi:hypothetical protein